MASFAPQDADFEVRVRESFARATLMKTMGVRLLRVAPGEVAINMPFRSDLTQHHGFLAGGIVTTLADAACVYAAMSLVPAGASALTVEYKVNFLSPAYGTLMIARGRVIRPGRTLTVCAGDVFAAADGAERHVAMMLATVMAMHGGSPEVPAGP